MRADHAISPHEVHRHLRGAQTIGSYVIDEHGCCRYAVFDADSEDGLHVLCRVQGKLAAEGIASHLESLQARRASVGVSGTTDTGICTTRLALAILSGWCRVLSQAK